MHMQSPSGNPHASAQDALRLVLRHAKQLQRDARSDSLAGSLPVLRRCWHPGSSATPRWPACTRSGSGYSASTSCACSRWKPAMRAGRTTARTLATLDPGQLEHFDLLRRHVGYPNLWFASLEEAQRHAAEHGGRAMRCGRQAVVI
jgi:hypothetical protein